MCHIRAVTVRKELIGANRSEMELLMEKRRNMEQVLNLRTTTSQKCAAVPRRARIEGP